MSTNTCIYYNYRVLGEVIEKRFKNDKCEFKRISFALSSQTPNGSGLYTKIYCHAFDAIADEILKLGIKDGDIITIEAEHMVYKKGEGMIENTYRIQKVIPVYIKKTGEQGNTAATKAAENTIQLEQKTAEKQSKEQVQLNAFMDVLTGDLFN